MKTGATSLVVHGRCLLFAMMAVSTACAEDGDVLRQDSGSGTASDSGGVQPDTCSGLAQQECSAQQQLGNCTPIWGTPYIHPPNGGDEWCLFANGLEYLGCRELDACPANQDGVTVCDEQSWWQIQLECLPAEIPGIDFCAPPEGPFIGFC